MDEERTSEACNVSLAGRLGLAVAAVLAAAIVAYALVMRQVGSPF